MRKSHKDLEEILFESECSNFENELNRIANGVERIDAIMKQLDKNAKQGHYIKSIISFAAILPDIIMLAKRTISLEKEMDEFSREHGI